VWLDDICGRTPDAGLVVRALVWMGDAIEEIAAEQFAEGR